MDTYGVMPYDSIMPVDRLSVALDPDLGAAVREAAARSRTTVSAWIADAVADRLRNELLRAALDAWDAEFGAPTEEELDAAAAEMGVERPEGARTS